MIAFWNYFIYFAVVAVAALGSGCLRGLERQEGCGI